MCVVLKGPCSVGFCVPSSGHGLPRTLPASLASRQQAGPASHTGLGLGLGLDCTGLAPCTEQGTVTPQAPAERTGPDEVPACGSLSRNPGRLGSPCSPHPGRATSSK